MGLPSTLMAVEWFITEVLCVSQLLATWRKHIPVGLSQGLCLQDVTHWSCSYGLFRISLVVVFLLHSMGFPNEAISFHNPENTLGQIRWKQRIQDWLRMVCAISWWILFLKCSLFLRRIEFPQSSFSFFIFVQLTCDTAEKAGAVPRGGPCCWDCVFKACPSAGQGRWRNYFL